MKKKRCVDAVTEKGLTALGLTASYPQQCPRELCQAIGIAAHEAKEVGIAARSAVLPIGEELAIFEKHAHLYKVEARESFAHWYPGVG